MIKSNGHSQKLRVLVYTAFFERYDVMGCEVGFSRHDVDYYCFTDRLVSLPAGWKLVVVDKPKNISSKVITENLKIMGADYFPDYDVAIWIDGNMAIRGSVDYLIDRLGGNALLVNDHRSRNCIYQEMDAVFSSGKADAQSVMNYRNRLLDVGYPPNNGLCETTVLVSDWRSPELREVMRQWWSEFAKGAYRDQLSLNYVLWLHPVARDTLRFGFGSDQHYFIKLRHVPKQLRSEKAYEIFAYITHKVIRSKRSSVAFILWLTLHRLIHRVCRFYG